MSLSPSLRPIRSMTGGALVESVGDATAGGGQGASETKSHAVADSFRGEIAPGEPTCDVWLHPTPDDELAVIRAKR